jgi:hypothetical protein
MKTIIIGSGYSGLNAYYEIKRDVKIVSLSNSFLFYTAYIRNLFDKKTRYLTELSFVSVDKIKDYDLKGKWVKGEKGEYIADNLIIAAGCDRNEQINFINKLFSKEEISLGSENELDDYLVIQLSFYFRKMGKKVKYGGNYLRYLGSNVEHVIREEMEKKGIKNTEKAEDILPFCKPSEPFQFFKVNEKLMFQNSFIIGDLISGFPKLGELAMRTGIYVGKMVKGIERKCFKPIFINIIDTGDSAIHIRSDKLWGGKIEIVKVSRIRQFMKRFIENYYILRKGKMGILYYL